MRNSMSNDIVINLQTGDLLFCYSGTNQAYYDYSIDNIRHSCYEHIGMVVRNPCFKDFTSVGLYVLEINDYQSGLKSTINLTTFDDFIKGRSRIDARCWYNLSDFYKNKLNNIYVNVTKKPYRRLCCFTYYKEDQFFYNAELIAYIFKEMGILNPKKFLEYYEPVDFSKNLSGMAFGLGDLIRLL